MLYLLRTGDKALPAGPQNLLFVQSVSIQVFLVHEDGNPFPIRYQHRVCRLPDGLGETRYDGFETGTLDGGVGWEAPWTYDTACITCVQTVTDTLHGGSYDGSYHVRLRGQGVISRTVDLARIEPDEIDTTLRIEGGIFYDDSASY